MARLLMIVEGQTEQTFARQVLAPHLGGFGVMLGKPALVGPKSRRKGRTGKGGLLQYLPLKLDIQRWLKQERGRDVYLTTMVDLYSLPSDFPGSSEAAQMQDPYVRVAAIEDRWSKDIDDSRFVPYVQLHEFEALLFSLPDRFEVYFPQRASQIEKLREIVAAAPDGNPERIDDGADTAPSKRIVRLFTDYKKTVAGPQIALAIGLGQIRAKCRHFNQWIARLESLGQTTISPA